MNSILFNSSLREETEKREPNFIGPKQAIIIFIIVTVIFEVIFYFLCFYFLSDTSASFSFGFFPIMYFAGCVTKFVILEFVVRPKLLKEKK